MNTAPEILATISEWLSSTAGASVPLGLPSCEAASRAARLRDALRTSEVPSRPLRIDDEAKDVLWALVDSLSEASDGSNEVTRVAQLLEQTDWASDELGERGEILSRVAYLGWKAARVEGDPVASQGWLGRFEEILFALRPPTCLTIELIAHRLRRLDQNDMDRLGSNPFLCFSLCSLLRRVANARPWDVAIGATELYGRLARCTQAWSPIDRQYSLGSLALVASGSYRNTGSRSAAEHWLEIATDAFTKLRAPAELLGEVWLSELALRHESGECDYVLAHIGDLLDGLQKFGAVRHLIKARLLHAYALKFKGRTRDALSVLEETRSRVGAQDSDLLAFAHLELADIYLIEGDLEAAENALADSIVLAARCGLRFFSITTKMAAGELARERGNVKEATRQFASAVDTALSCGAQSHAARARLLLADTLVSSDQLSEARGELLLAWKTFREQKMAPEALVTVGLLREINSRRAVPYPTPERGKNA